LHKEKTGRAISCKDSRLSALCTDGRLANKIFALIKPPLGLGPELICDDHGLFHVCESHRVYIKNKSTLDIGAWTGDSALVLAKYDRVVYRFESSPVLFQVVLRAFEEARPLAPEALANHPGLSAFQPIDFTERIDSPDLPPN
jgi:hypothetical protein